MRRRAIITAILCLLLGAAISIGVAWGCAGIRLQSWDSEDPFVTPPLPPWSMNHVMRRPGAVIVQSIVIGAAELDALLNPTFQVERVAALREQATTYPVLLPNPQLRAGDQQRPLTSIETIDARGWPFPALCRRAHEDLSAQVDEIRSEPDLADRQLSWIMTEIMVYRAGQDTVQRSSWRGEVFWRGFTLNTVIYAMVVAIFALFLRLVRVVLNGWRRRSKLVIASISIAAGAANTVAVAWSFAAWGEFTKRAYLRQKAAHSILDIDPKWKVPESPPVLWSVFVDDGDGLSMIRSSVSHARGDLANKSKRVPAAEDLVPRWAESFLGPSPASLATDATGDRRYAAASGWPSLAMYALWERDAEGPTMRVGPTLAPLEQFQLSCSGCRGHAALGVATAHRGLHYRADHGARYTIPESALMRALSAISLDTTVTSNSPLGSMKLPRALPLGIIWPGFVINTMLYAFVWFALIVLALSAFTLRGRLRQRRGCCRRCGYDLRGRGAEHAVCPECGTAPVFTTKSSR